MKYIKLFEDFVSITEKDIINCINKKIGLFINSIPNYDGKYDEPFIPVSVENDTITIEKDGKFYDVDISEVSKIENIVSVKNGKYDF
jgi:hypothetical protein